MRERRQKGMLDAKQASAKALEYFVTIHGNFSVWEFQIDNANFNQQRKEWVIQCSFRPMMNAPERYRYEVLIDGEEGTVREVKRLPEAAKA